jgi:exodeoxyribonuclease VIII
MIDLETWSTQNHASIISIGAVKFVGDDILDTFHVGVDPRSGPEYGLHTDPDTVLWWMDPERDEARKAWLELSKVDIYSALAGFSDWFGPESMPVWGNGATFDNVILREAFKRVNVFCPWKFWHDRCYRTMKSVHPIPADPREGTHHNALDDALYQTKHLIKIREML